MWMNDFTPSNITELVVSKSKIIELKNKLENALNSFDPTILLLSGPTGCGKTTTLKVICNTIGIEIREWINTISLKLYNNKSNYISSESYYELFWDFILRANRYSIQQIFDKKLIKYRNIVLVKDFPNFLLINKEKLKQFILKYKQFKNAVPLVFILSDKSKSNSEIQLIFSSINLLKYNIECIKFNAISKTALFKTVNSIIHKTSFQIKYNLSNEDYDILKNIIILNKGDIHYTINSIYFYLKERCLDYSECEYHYPNISNKIFDCSQNVLTNFRKNKKLSLKDSNISLFKTIGKILHYKKKEYCVGNKNLQSHLKNAKESPMLFDINNLLLETILSSEAFNSYLNFNYLPFFNSIYDILHISMYFADTDLFFEKSLDNVSISEFSNMIAARGILFHKSEFQDPGWYPLLKPKLISSNMSRLKTKFNYDSRWQITFSEYLLQYTPFVSKLNSEMINHIFMECISTNMTKCFKSKESYDEEFLNTNSFYDKETISDFSFNLYNIYEPYNDLIIDEYDK